MCFLILSTKSNQNLYIYFLFIHVVSGTLQESMRCPEKREGPYSGIYLFEMYRHIFSSYHIDSIKEVLFV